MDPPTTDSVSKIPNEIVAEIFKLSLPRPIVIPCPYNRTALPWVLQCVCRKWRSIAQNLVNLWTDIFVNYESMDPMGNPMSEGGMDAEKATEIAGDAISRNEGAVLSLRIQCDTFAMSNRIPLVNLVLENAHRLRHLELRMFGDALNDIFSSFVPSENLEFLSVATFEEDIYAVVPPRTFRDVPGLRVVEMEIFIDWQGITPYLRWERVEHLSIQGDHWISPAVALEVILCCPNLITLQVMVETDKESTITTPPATSPCMETLLIESYEFRAIDEFLRYLYLPSLNRLELRCSGDNIDLMLWDNPSLHLIIPRFTQLEVMKIAFPIPRNYNIKPFLTAIPSVVELTLPFLSHQTLNSLISSALLPNLRTLRTYIPSEFLSAHLAMLKERTANNSNAPHLLLHSLSNHPVESEIRRGNENIGISGEHVQLVNVREVHSQMRDFIPPHMKPIQ